MSKYFIEVKWRLTLRDERPASHLVDPSISQFRHLENFERSLPWHLLDLPNSFAPLANLPNIYVCTKRQTIFRYILWSSLDWSFDNSKLATISKHLFVGKKLLPQPGLLKPLNQVFSCPELLNRWPHQAWRGFKTKNFPHVIPSQNRLADLENVRV